MHRNCHILFMFILLLTGCTDFIADIDGQTDWLVAEQGSVVLHYRRPGFSKTRSPDAAAVQTILENQNDYVAMINDSLDMSFVGSILIYLFNYDEAEEAIGTSGGGHAIPSTLRYYYTFADRPARDPDGRIYYVGAHELVHVMSHHLLGAPGTKMMSEGYAVALDGSYGIKQRSDGTLAAKPVREWMLEYRVSGHILSPSQMLEQIDLAERIYYPNAGYFTGWLFARYGVLQIHSLFPVPERSFRTRFEAVTGDSFDVMEQEYLEHCAAFLAAP